MYWETHFCYFQSPTVDCRACIANVGDARLRWSRLMILSGRWRWNSDIVPLCRLCWVILTLSVTSSDSPSPLSGTFSIGSIDSPLSSSITPSLFHSRLKTFLFCKSFPPLAFLFFFRTDSTDPGLFTNTSEHVLRSIGKQFFSFSVFHFLVIGSMW